MYTRLPLVAGDVGASEHGENLTLYDRHLHPCNTVRKKGVQPQGCCMPIKVQLAESTL